MSRLEARSSGQFGASDRSFTEPERRSLSVSGDDVKRGPNQRAAFGKFCLNAANHPLPPYVERRRRRRWRLFFVRRKLLGLTSPLLNALIEVDTTDTHNVWTAAEMAVNELAPQRAKLIKLFTAGAPPEIEPGAARVRGPDIGRFRTVFVRADAREALTLPPSYDQLLSRLGRHTRRDMRRLRRHAAARGIEFAMQSTPGAAASERASLRAFTRPAIYSALEIAAYDRFLAAQDHCFYASLRHADGSLVSCAAGFVDGETAYLLYQLNHRGYPKWSLSLTNRAFLLEWLIATGVRELVLPGGSSGLLRYACELRRTGEIVLVERSMTATLMTHAIALLRKESSIAAVLHG